MFRKMLLPLSALCLAAQPCFAHSEGLDGGTQHSITTGRAETGAGSYGDRNRGGPYGFTSYPNHRHIDGGASLDRAPPALSAGTSPNYDGYHGSAYYGRNYGAPYFGGGYYDEGVYYRERRER